jgi:hypothetical protein
MEVEHTLLRRAKKAITDMRHGAGLLARLSTQSINIPLPNDIAISGAISKPVEGFVIIYKKNQTK